MAIVTTTGTIKLMHYNTLTNMIAFVVSPNEVSPSEDMDFLLVHDMFNIAQFMENAMRNKDLVAVSHEEGDTYVQTIGSAS